MKMAKKIRVHYSSFLNITFSGVEDIECLDENFFEDLTPEELEKELREIEEEWLFENVDVWAEVVDD